MKQINKVSAWTRTMSLQEAGRMLRDEIVKTADVRRPAKGADKPMIGKTKQVSRDDAPGILTALLDDLDKRGIRVEVSDEQWDIYDRFQAARWAREQFSSLTSGSREATDEDPFNLVRKLFGRLTWCGKKKGKSGRALSVYISTDAMTPAEFHIAAQRFMNKGNRESELGNKAKADALKVIDFMQPNETLREAEERYRSETQQGLHL